MKEAIEQLSNDMTIIYAALHFLESYPAEDPLRPEMEQLISVGTVKLEKDWALLREQVQRCRSQCLHTRYSRVRSNYLRMPNNPFSIVGQGVPEMPTQTLVLSLLDELHSSIQNRANYADCKTLGHSVIVRLRQFYQMTAPVRRKRLPV